MFINEVAKWPIKVGSPIVKDTALPLRLSQRLDTVCRSPLRPKSGKPNGQRIIMESSVVMSPAAGLRRECRVAAQGCWPRTPPTPQWERHSMPHITQADYGAMLERNPGLLASHSTNFAVYGERVAALHAWAPEGLDLGKVIPMLLPDRQISCRLKRHLEV